MATLREVIIDTDSAFPGFEYTALATAESNEQADISSSDEYVVINCLATAGTADTNRTTFTGWTTAPTCYIKITSPTAFASGSYPTASYRHSGVWDTSIYRYEITGGTNSKLGIEENYFRIEGLQIGSLAEVSNQNVIQIFNIVAGGSEIRIEKCLIRSSGDGTYTQRGVNFDDSDITKMVIANNIIYNVANGILSYPIYGNCNAFVYNNTLIGGYYTIRDGSTALLRSKNNICQGSNVRSFYDIMHADSGYNIVDSANVNSAQGTTLKTGTDTAGDTNKLTDSGSGLSVARVGSVIANTTDNSYTFVTVVDSDTVLSLNDDIFGSPGDDYTIYTNIVGTVQFQDSASGNFLLDSKDIVAMFHGTNSYDDPNLPVTDDILGNSRGSADTDTYDIGAHHSLEYARVVDPGSGSGYDYTSLLNWEAGEQADISISGLYKIAVATCRSTDGTVDSTNFTIDGWTTSAANYIKIWTDPAESYRHAGVYPSGNKYRFECPHNNELIYLADEHIRFEGLSIKGIWSVGAQAVFGMSAAVLDFRLEKCIIADGGGANEGYGLFNETLDGGALFYISNNIVYDMYYVYRCNGGDGDSLRFFNNTVSSINGLRGGGESLLKNNIVLGGFYAATYSTNSEANIESGVQFQDSASDNYLLDSKDTVAMFNGVNLYTSSDYPITDDIIGNSRGNAETNTYDIGAHHSLEFTKVVDTDSGAGFDYTSLATWESNEQADISVTGSNKIAIVECRATAGTVDSFVSFAGWNTDQTNYIEAKTTGSYRHNGVWDDTKYRIVEASGEDCIDNYEAHFSVTGVQLHNNNAASIKMGIRDFESSDATGEKIYSYNLIKGSNSATYNMRGISVSLATGGVSKIFNNIIYDVNTAATSHGVYLSGGDNYVFNNTILGGTNGITRNSGNGIFINNLCQNAITNGIDWAGTAGTSSGFNINEDTPLAENSTGGSDYDLATGTADGDTTNKLRDSGGGLLNAVVGSIIKNTTDSTYTWTTAIDSDIQLSINDDIFASGTGSYRVTSNIYGNPEFQDSASDNYLLDSKDIVAMFNGTNLYTSSIVPITDDILSNSRGNAETNTYDIGAHHSLEYSKVVDTDSGVGFDYTSLATWESSEQADISVTGSNKIAVATCKASAGTADVGDGDGMLIGGWVTDTIGYIKVWTSGSDRHAGVWDDTKYRLTSTNSGANTITVEADYTRIIGLQIRPTHVDSNIVVRIRTCVGVRVEKCIVAHVVSGGGTNGIYMAGIAGTVSHYASNNIVYNHGGASNESGMHGEHNGTGKCYFYNNTIYNCYDGMDTGAGDTIAINNIITGSAGIIMDGSFGAGTTNNVSESITFVDAANNNFLLDSKDIGAMFQGTNLYDSVNLPIIDDILGNSRGNENTDSYDAGAHHSLEYGRVVDPGSGSGFDYTSLANWEANEQTDLPISAKNKICVAICRNTDGTDDFTPVTINGWTTGATGYPKVWTDPDEVYRHPGYWIAGNYYRLVVSNDAAIDVREADFHLEGVQIQVDAVDFSGNESGVIMQYFGAVAVSHMQIIGNVFKGAGLIGSSQYHFGVSIKSFDTGSTGQVDVYNNVIFDFGRGENYNNGGIEFYNDGGALTYVDMYAYNNTIVSCSKGIESTGTGTGTFITIKNNLIYGGHRGYNLVSSATFGSASGHNVWDDTPASNGAFGAQWASGRNTSVVSGKLTDSGSDFSNVQLFSLVVDVTDGAYTNVTSLDSSTQLGLANDHFTGNEEYIIYTNMRATPVFEDFDNDNFLLDSTDTAAQDKGKDLSTDGQLAFSTDIIGTTRPQNLIWDIGAFEFSSSISPTGVTTYVTFYNSGKTGTTSIKMYNSNLGGNTIVIS